VIHPHTGDAGSATGGRDLCCRPVVGDGHWV